MKSKSKKYRWKPIVCGMGTILQILKQGGNLPAELVIVYHEEIYKIGIASDYNKKLGKFFDTVFYINDKEYKSWEQFETFAEIGGVRITEIYDPVEVVEADEGDPANLTIFKNY